MTDQNRWTMHGLAKGDQRALKTWEEAEKLIEALGFLPLFRNEVPGFSLEEHTEADSWFTGEKTDPWEWRKDLALNGRVAYGKLFAGKAGFVSKKWYPIFANYRRDGYDFDARWDDELASIRSKKIMDLFMENPQTELFSYQIKEMAGFGQGKEKSFEPEMTKLMMQGYLLIKDFRQKISKEGKAYGWSNSLYCTPEHLWGEEFITKGYEQNPKDSLSAILEHLQRLLPEANKESLRRLLLSPGNTEKSQSKTDLSYPANLIKAMRVKDLSCETMSPDQLLGLNVAMGQLQLKHQKLLWQKYHDLLSKEEMAKKARKAVTTIGTHHAKAMSRLRMSDLSLWYLEGYNKNIRLFLKARGLPFLHPYQPDLGLTMEDYCLALGLRLDVFHYLLLEEVVTIQDLDKYIKRDPVTWHKPIRGVGFANALDIQNKLTRAMENMPKEGLQPSSPK